MTEETRARHRILNEEYQVLEVALMPADDPSPESKNMYQTAVWKKTKRSTTKRHHVKTFNGYLTDNLGSKYFPDGKGGYNVEGCLFTDEKFHFHEEKLMGFIAAADGLKYYLDSTWGFNIKSPDNKETRIWSFSNVVAVDGVIYSDDGLGGLMVKGPDGQMHLADSLFIGYLTAEDGSRYYPDYFGEFDVELPRSE